MLGMIWAQAENGVIGDGMDIPWDVQGDRTFYRFVTTQGSILHGRVTHESLPHGALPNRRNIILTRDEDYSAPGTQTVHSKEEALALFETLEEPVFISGGAQVYELFLEDVTHIYRSVIHTEVEGDHYAPAIDKDKFALVFTQSYEADEANEYPFTIEMYKRKDLLP